MTDFDDNNADRVIEREHPSSDRDFAVVAVLAALTTEMDATGSELPPLWPRVLHCFRCFVDRWSLWLIGSLLCDWTCIPLLMRALCSPLIRHQQAGARGVHSLMTQYDPPIDRFVASGAMRPLAGMLEDDSGPLTQMHVVCALARISCTPKHTAELVKVPGTVAGFVRLLLSANEDVCVQAARMLGNCADLLPGALRNDALGNLVQLLARSKVTETLNLRRNVVWTISECCRAQPPPPLSLAAAAVPLLVETVRNADVDVAIDSMWALTYVSQCGVEYISVVIENGALSAIMPHLQSRASDVARPALRCLGNVLRGDNHQVALAVAHGAITALCELRTRSQSPSKWHWERMKDILQALANIAGGDAQQVNALLQAGVFDFIANDVGNRGAPTSCHDRRNPYCFGSPDAAAEDDSGDDEAGADEAEGIRYESQRIVANGLRNASDADRTAIIGSASFRALLTAATTQRIGFAGMEGIDFVLNRSANVNTDELAAIASALRRIKRPTGQQVERINSWLRRFKAEPLTDVTSIQQPRRKQPPPP
jgi:hypothetical protein